MTKLGINTLQKAGTASGPLFSQTRNTDIGGKKKKKSVFKKLIGKMKIIVMLSASPLPVCNRFVPFFKFYIFNKK